MPLGPLINVIASNKLLSSNKTPSTDRIVSPARIPAASAGPPAIGETITIFPSRVDWTWAPIPSNFPWRSSLLISWRAALTYAVWGSSSSANIPLIAASANSSGENSLLATWSRVKWAQTSQIINNSSGTSLGARKGSSAGTNDGIDIPDSKSEDRSESSLSKSEEVLKGLEEPSPHERIKSIRKANENIIFNLWNKKDSVTNICHLYYLYKPSAKQPHIVKILFFQSFQI